MSSATRSHLHEMPSRFAALMKAAVDGIIVIDSHGHIQDFNPAAERLFGYTREEVAGHNVSVLMPPQYAAEHDHYLARYNATGEARIIGIGREVLAQRKNGEVFPIDLSVGEVREQNASFFVGIIRDISDRKEAEEALRQREEMLRQIIDHAPLGIITCDDMSRMLAVNRMLCSMLQFTESDLVGRFLADIVHPYDLGLLRSHTDRFFWGRDASFTIDTLRLRRADGPEVACRMRASAVHDARGQPQQMILLLEDLTEQLAAQKEAQQHRDRLSHVTRLSTLGEMASGIAHEINQPLTAIATYAQAARRLYQKGAGQDLDAALEKIGQQAERAAAVIKRLRSFVKQQESEQVLIDPNAMVVEVVQFLQMDTGRRHVDIHLELQEGLPQVLADNVQVQQVLLNLLLNALDATTVIHSQAPVTVISRREDEDLVAIDVVDLGCGITPEQQAQLFSPFFTTKASGMGMGLAICRSIINAHGGQLSYRPNATQGSVFTFTLPVISEA